MLQNLTQLANKFADCFTKKNVQGIAELITHNFILEDPVLKRVEGKEKVIAIFREQFEKTKNVAYNIVNLYQVNNTTIVEFNITMDDIVLNGVDFMEWDNSKMKELRCYFNPTC